MEFLLFRVNQHRLGVSALKVDEIRAWEGVEVIPGMPAIVLGAVNLRGVIVPIIDLRMAFKLKYQAPMRTSVVIYIDLPGHGRCIGLLVDSVEDVIDVTQKQLMPVPDLERVVDAGLIESMVDTDDGMVLILAVEKLFECKSLYDSLVDVAPAEKVYAND